MSIHTSATRSTRNARVTIVTLCVLPILLACSGDGRHQRAAIDPSHAGLLTGTWDITLQLERPMSLRTTAAELPHHVTGSVALLEDRQAERSFAAMKDPTHIGVYDIALDSLELPPWDAGVVPGLAAPLIFELTLSCMGQAPNDSFRTAYTDIRPTRIAKKVLSMTHTTLRPSERT